MSTSALLLIALASVVLLLLLVIKAKAHPFVALLIVSLLVAFATGIPADKIITTIEKGHGRPAWSHRQHYYSGLNAGGG